MIEESTTFFTGLSALHRAVDIVGMEDSAAEQVGRCVCRDALGLLSCYRLNLWYIQMMLPHTEASKN